MRHFTCLDDVDSDFARYPIPVLVLVLSEIGPKCAQSTMDMVYVYMLSSK